MPINGSGSSSLTRRDRAGADISHADTQEHAGIEEAKVILSTISDDFLRRTSNLTILKQLRAMSPHAKIIVRAEKVKDARAMYEAGADYVLLPRVEDGTLDQASQAERQALGARQEVVA